MLCSKQIYILTHLGECFSVPAHWPAKVTPSPILVKWEKLGWLRESCALCREIALGARHLTLLLPPSHSS